MITTQGVRLSRAAVYLLFEAYRRNHMFDPHERAKPLDQRWLGLGTEAAYRPVLGKGLMRFHDDRNPPPRCMGWVCLTELGIKVMKELEPQFQKELQELHSSPRYKSSLRAQYTLAGGITRR